MISSFEATNYRGFQDLKLSNLGLVNIITGANGTGKTALLEGILFAARGQPQAVLWANRLRGLPDFLPQPALNSEFFRTTWDNLFRKVDTPVTFSFSEQGQTAHKSLKVYYSKEAVFAGGGEITSSGTFTRPIVFERFTPPSTVETAHIGLNDQGLFITNFPQDFGSRTFYFSALLPFNETDSAIWFSDLKISGRANRLINSISTDFPFVQGIEILAPTGRQSIYASLSDGATRQLSLISSGIHKVFNIYCGLSDLEDGVVLIDEIENGIYYERYASLWRNLHRMCRDANNQLFVSCHSAECLEALLPVLEEHVDDFCLLRAERIDGACSVRQITGQAMRAALRGEVELRGTTRATTAIAGC